MVYTVESRIRQKGLRVITRNRIYFELDATGALAELDKKVLT